MIHWGECIQFIFITVISQKWPNLLFTGEKVPNQFKIALMHKRACYTSSRWRSQNDWENMFQKQQGEKSDGRANASFPHPDHETVCNGFSSCVEARMLGNGWAWTSFYPWEYKRNKDFKEVRDTRVQVTRRVLDEHAVIPAVRGS